ncbi:sterol carrier family protein [Alphaproteobacteria bacterium GH1-50]|uniref:Sterol carrier family protein n=1 Tax=Kangsaoukella pontilimi TaxID=2691042 RepID=A0A7C9MEV4_9RHOB|nr:SCP2 sterol-binding domain-containing protein [Kangsaoukella pontilimi]MXQ09071.1 sterol carrier family protein [Kangsaoukella pontilimi]
MSDVITHAVAALNEKLDGSGFDGTAKFVIEDEGAIMLDENGARAGDEEADVTMTSDTETFRAIMDGSQNPTAAFMTGKLKIDGDMGAAMRLGSTLS